VRMENDGDGSKSFGEFNSTKPLQIIKKVSFQQKKTQNNRKKKFSKPTHHHINALTHHYSGKKQNYMTFGFGEKKRTICFDIVLFFFLRFDIVLFFSQVLISFFFPPSFDIVVLPPSMRVISFLPLPKHACFIVAFPTHPLPRHACDPVVFSKLETQKRNFRNIPSTE